MRTRWPCEGLAGLFHFKGALHIKCRNDRNKCVSRRLNVQVSFRRSFSKVPGEAVTAGNDQADASADDQDEGGEGEVVPLLEPEMAVGVRASLGRDFVRQVFGSLNEGA